jgi:hypothetical protein
MPQEIPPRPFQPGSTLLWTDLSVTLLIDQIHNLLRDEFHNPTFVRHHWLDLMASLDFLSLNWPRPRNGAFDVLARDIPRFAADVHSSFPHIRRMWGYPHTSSPSDIAELLIRWGFPPEPDRTFIYYGFHLAGPKLHVSFCRRDQIPAQFLTSD